METLSSKTRQLGFDSETYGNFQFEAADASLTFSQSY
jgi:hypothetical protein